MKLLLVIVTTIVVFNADCRDLSTEHESHDITIEARVFPAEIEALGEEQHFQSGLDSIDLAENQDSAEPNNQQMDIPLLAADGTKEIESIYEDNEMKTRVVFADEESQDQDYSNIDQQMGNVDSTITDTQWPYLQEKVENEHQRKIRKSRCKARNACVVMGGFCVTNATLCNGRVVPEGCKGLNCQCCVPGIIEAKLDNFEKELHSMKDAMNNINSDIDSELQSLKDNINSSNSKLDSIAKNQAVCPEGFFKVPASLNQCFKYFNDTVRTWHAAKTKCQQEGLVLAKPLDPLALRIFLVNNFGNTWAWIGARGTGTYVKWERDATIIQSNNPMWMSSYPSGETSSSYCLEIQASASGLQSTPYQLYKQYSCSSSGGTYALCELI